MQLRALCFAVAAVAAVAAAEPLFIESHPRFDHPTNVINPLFAAGSKCRRCRVVVWGNGGYGGAKAPADVTNPAEGAEVVAVARSKNALQ